MQPSSPITTSLLGPVALNVARTTSTATGAGLTTPKSSSPGPKQQEMLSISSQTLSTPMTRSPSPSSKLKSPQTQEEFIFKDIPSFQIPFDAVKLESASESQKPILKRDAAPSQKPSHIAKKRKVEPLDSYQLDSVRRQGARVLEQILNLRANCFRLESQSQNLRPLCPPSSLSTIEDSKSFPPSIDRIMIDPLMCQSTGVHLEQVRE